MIGVKHQSSRPWLGKALQTGALAPGCAASLLARHARTRRLVFDTSLLVPWKRDRYQNSDPILLSSGDQLRRPSLVRNHRSRGLVRRIHALFPSVPPDFGPKQRRLVRATLRGQAGVRPLPYPRPRSPLAIKGWWWSDRLAGRVGATPWRWRGLTLVPFHLVDGRNRVGGIPPFILARLLAMHFSLHFSGDVLYAAPVCAVITRRFRGERARSSAYASI
jgi:hypothetical protein